jgi:hypothetical protein
MLIILFKATHAFQFEARTFNLGKQLGKAFRWRVRIGCANLASVFGTTFEQ